MKIKFLWLNFWKRPGKARNFLGFYTTRDGKKYAIYEFMDSRRDTYVTADSVVAELVWFTLLVRKADYPLINSYASCTSILEHKAEERESIKHFGNM